MSNGEFRNAPFLLFYSVPAEKRQHFETFVREGHRVNGVIQPDENGAQKTGVIDWLRSSHLFDTKFYSGEGPNGSLLFIATADRVIPEEEQHDWFEIPGFESEFGRNTKLFIRGELNDLVAASPQPSDGDD
jgi:hypothetical protein